MDSTTPAAPPLLTRAEARDLLAWVRKLESHRSYNLARIGASGFNEVQAFKAGHPLLQEAYEKFAAYAEGADESGATGSAK